MALIAGGSFLKENREVNEDIKDGKKGLELDRAGLPEMNES